ncbi:MAG: IgGFc-binding protein [Nannocystaceae bacterium]
MPRSLRRLPAAVAPLVALALACNGSQQTTESESGSTDSSNTSITTNPTNSSESETGPALLCVPGTVKCNDALDAVITCTEDGQAWEDAPCGMYQQCIVDECLGPCELVQDPPSSEGCSFWGNRMRHYENPDDPEIDALIVGNISNDQAVTVQLYGLSPLADEVPIGDPVVVESGKTHLFELSNPLIAAWSLYRTGGSYHVVSDLPIIAYLHSPLDNAATNDSSMLLPDHALGMNYVVASYPDFGEPSYFNIIATEPETTVTWTPPVDTAGNGLPVPFVEGGQSGTMKMAFPGDTLQIGASAVKGDMKCAEIKQQCIDDGGSEAECNVPFEACNDEERQKRDVSGTVITADKPIWVMGAGTCAFVPFDKGFCDHLQEQMVPLEYWGKEYVGAHSPTRLDEKHYWRVYAGEDNVTITTEPAQAGTPITLSKRGEWAEFTVDTGVSFVFKSEKPFLPVQYIAGAQSGPGFGDPAMYQMVPVEQFLKRYAFVTGVGYELNYAQVVHEKGDAPIVIDGVEVNGYYDVGDYEVADWQIEEGPHEAVSDDPFGLINIGYTIPNNCNPVFVDPECDTAGHAPCCRACTGACTIADGNGNCGVAGKKPCCNDEICNAPGLPVCECAGSYASYAYPGGMRLKQIYNP